jgi:hypothetical protein
MLLFFICLFIFGLVLLGIGLSGITGKYLERKAKPKEQIYGEKKMKGKNIMLGITILLTIITIVAGVGLFIGDMTGPGYEFQYEVHGHMENAYYANQPELMKSELQMCKQGMEDLGLEENMFATIWSWDKTPNKRMDYQYNHLDSILDRVESVIDWRNEVYGNTSGSSETLGDVYEQKMDNLRRFLKEDRWSDWISKDTYYANFHLIYYLSGIIMMILASILIVMWVICAWMAAEY